MKIPKNFDKPVSLKVIAEGICLCERNAFRLIQDAEILINAERFLSAINLLRLAVEEMAKEHILWQSATYGNLPSTKWQWLWTAFSDHREKIRVIEYEIHWPTYEDKQEFDARVTEMLNTREESLYVNFDTKLNKFISPEEFFPDAQKTAHLEHKYALGLYKISFPVGRQTEQEILQTLEFTAEDAK